MRPQHAGVGSFCWQLHSALPVSHAGQRRRWPRPAPRRLILIDLIKYMQMTCCLVGGSFYCLTFKSVSSFVRMAGGGPEGGAHFAPLGAKRPCRHVAVWSHRCADTSNRRASFSMGRGQPVGPLLATSSDGGGIAADSIAARPVQVLVALRPGCSVTALFQNGLDATSLNFTGALRRISPRSCSQGFGPIGGLAMVAAMGD